MITPRGQALKIIIIPDGSNKAAGLLQSSYRNISDKSGNMPLAADNSRWNFGT
jgi:hypothetical protein